MRAKTMTGICGVLIAVLIGTTNVWAARKPAPAPAKPLSERGQKLETLYAKQLDTLKAEITKALPKIDEAKKAEYLKACETEKSAEAAKNAAHKAFGAIKSGRGAVGHAKGKWIGGADKGIAETQARLKEAKTDEERKALQEQLVKWQKNRADGVAALKERQAKLDAALADEPRMIKERDAAEEAYAKAQAATLKAVDELGVEKCLSSDKLDAKLAEYVVLLEATPRGLAEFAQQGEDAEELVEKLVKDHDLMIQMCIADGANGGKYGQAMKIYTQIQRKSKKAKDGVLQRLALAIALEHAVPRGQRSAVGDTDAPKYIDPLKRYMHFEKAYLADELDPGFKELSVWDYRMTVDGEEPDEILAWGREMLRNYRPDHISTPDYRWRYVASVRSDIR